MNELLITGKLESAMAWLRSLHHNASADVNVWELCHHWGRRRLQQLLPVYSCSENAVGPGGDKTALARWRCVGASWKIRGCMVLACALYAMPAAASITGYNVTALAPCTPTRVLSMSTSSNVIQGFMSFGYVFKGVWSGHGGPLSSQGDIGDVTGAGDHYIAAPVAATICGQKVRAVSADGHAGLYTPAGANVSLGTVHNLAGTQSSDQIILRVSPDEYNTYNASGLYSMRAAWPARLALTGYPKPYSNWVVTSVSVNAEVWIVWDGVTPSDPHDYDLLSNQFTGGAYSTITGGIGYSNELENSPAVTVSVAVPPPTCHTLLNWLDSPSQTAVTLGDIDPKSALGGKRAGFTNLATTTVKVHCANADGSTTDGKSSTVSPRLTFSGATDSAVGPYYLKTSQTGIFLYGHTPGGTDSCGYWGTTSGAGYGSVPWNDTERWNAGWGDTSSMNNGSWTSSTTTIQWGACLDTSGGRTINAGPFTATGTWTLHLD